MGRNFYYGDGNICGETKNEKYYQYYLDISEDALFEGLLGYGMFSDRLPPIFSSADFQPEKTAGKFSSG